ncbi:MAG: hypothetical protein LBE22_10320 [Azoarcus sp.]|jgi:GH24 family phage-related lysozyme (muramidase)|nr:hypothetical protein [Azoarcus sp.]
MIRKNAVTWGSVAAMTAAGIAFTLNYEGAPKPGATESVAIVPVPGDPHTLDVGGLTYYPSTGLRVKPGDRVSIERAIEEFSLATKENVDCVRRSCPDCKTPMTLVDLAGDFVHQFGCTTWRNSSLLTLARARKLQEHCDFYLRYRFVRKFDCATPGNKICAGVWTRAKARAELCHSAIN